MVRELVLKADNKSLELKIVNELGWCSVFFKHGGRMDELGADTYKIVAKKILKVLDPDNFPESNANISYKKNENYVRFIMLSEKHTVGCAKKTTTGVLLHFINTHNEPIKPIGEINLSHKDCEVWRVQLEEFLVA